MIFEKRISLLKKTFPIFWALQGLTSADGVMVKSRLSMYLVQLSLFSFSGSDRLPGGVQGMLYSSARKEDGLEHVSVSRRADVDLVIGLFLRSPGLAEAERTAALLWWRAVDTYPELVGYQLFRAEVPLIDDGGCWPGEGV